MLAFELYIHELPISPEKSELLGLHKSFDALILIFASLRILWLMKKKFPISLSTTPNYPDPYKLERLVIIKSVQKQVLRGLN